MRWRCQRRLLMARSANHAVWSRHPRGRGPGRPGPQASDDGPTVTIDTAVTGGRHGPE